jgi:hypothetical protein
MPYILAILPWVVLIALIIVIVKLKRELKVHVKKEGLKEVEALADVASAAEAVKKKKGGSLEKQVEKDAKTVEDADRASDKARQAL